MRLTAAITCHNNAELTELCVNALKGQTIAPDEIILVDNASTDNTRELFENMPGVKYIRREINDGVIIGRNIAIKAAIDIRPHRIFILDNDQICPADTIEKYYAEFARGADVVGCYLNECNRFGIGESIPGMTGSGREYLGAGGLMVRSDVFDTVGWFDEGFSPAYCEDPDWIWSAEEGGYTWRHCADAAIMHIPHSTLGKMKSAETERAYKDNHIRLIYKWKNKFKQAIPEPKPKDKKKILLISDTVDWAFARECDAIHEYLSGEYEIDRVFANRNQKQNNPRPDDYRHMDDVDFKKYDLVIVREIGCIAHDHITLARLRAIGSNRVAITISNNHFYDEPEWADMYFRTRDLYAHVICISTQVYLKAIEFYNTRCPGAHEIYKCKMGIDTRQFCITNADLHEKFTI